VVTNLRGRHGAGFRFDRVTAVRLLMIHDAIRRECFPNVQRLAEEFEVHPRTIQRDLAALRDFLGAPIRYDSRRRGYCYAEEYELPQVRLTEGEVATFYLGCHMLAHFRGTPFEEGIESALSKLALMLPGQVSAHLSELGRFLSLDTGPAWGDAEAVAANLRMVSSAIEDRRQLRITYYSPGRDAETVRTIAPYHLRFDNGVWYVIAYCDFREDIRIFALHRMRQIEETSLPFKVPDGFSIDEYLGLSWSIIRGEVRDVRIRFDPHAARWVRECMYHPTQRIEDEPDGSIVASFRVSGLEEIKRWVLQFGRRAEVLDPPELRGEMLDEARGMAGIYD